MDNETANGDGTRALKRVSLTTFFADRRASFSVQYAVLATISGTATVLAVRVIGNDLAAQFERILAALTRSGPGLSP
ncbi:hypothetical protein [Bradyrhizobium sp.]|uniref:hypothetical protein n=1 Tax=Bradyrhizobium sp. TaxID=376 RepID=UPI003C629C8E